MTVENNVSSSTQTTAELPQSFPGFNNFASMDLELSDITERIRSIRTRGRQDYQFDNHSSSEDEKGNSIFNPIDLDGDSPPATKCPTCNFDMVVAALCDRSEDQTYPLHTMICPVCYGNSGEEAMRMVQSSILPKNPRENDVSVVDWALHDKEYASRENNQHNPTSDSHLSPSQDNVYVPSSDEFFSDEDTISDASDVAVEKGISDGKSFEKDAPDTSDEQDVQERSDRAAFAQELLISALFLD